jgi:hypothetical protein
VLYGSEEHKARLMGLLEDGSDYMAGLAEEFLDGHLVGKCLVMEAIESAAGNAPPPPDASDYSESELRGLFPVTTN